jgi:hypothetical protein
MANQAIALQARAPQGNFLAPAIQQGAQFINMMSQQRAAERQAAAQEQTMRLQMAQEGRAAAGEARKIVADDQERAKVRAGAIGSGLIGLLRDPSDAGLAQTVDTFKSLGMNPAEYEGVMAQLSKMPDANQRKVFTLQFIAQSEDARNALKYVMPNIKAEKIGDASVFMDDNPNSPTFGSELFRITASPEPVKLNQQVVDSTLYNINPLTGAASEATIGDARAGLVPQQRTLTRMDTGVVSPYAIQNAAAPPAPAAVDGLPGPRAAVPAPAPMAAAPAAMPAATARGAPRGPQIEQLVGQLSPGVVVTGRARTPERNAEVGGVPNSLHMSDNARDFRPAAGQSVDDLFKKLSPLKAQGYDVVLEKNKNIVHVETGPGMGRATAPATPRAATPVAAPTGGQTIAEAARRKAAALVLPIIGYNAETGTSVVEDLIKASTSGVAEMIGSEIVGGVTGKGTPGRTALQQLRGIEKNMTFEKLRGKLGSAVSDRDVQLVSDTMADIANGNTPANVRLAAWQNVVLPILLRGAGLEVKTPVRDGGGQTTVTTKKLPKIGEIRNGYSFIGGDPGKQTSWKKVR